MAPKPSRRVAAPLALAASLLLPLLSSAGPVEKNPVGKGTVQVAEAHPMYLGTINSGIKTNDAYTDGNFSIVAPIWSTLGADSTLSGGVLFLEPYVSYGEGGEVAASFGLGYRHLFGTQSVSALTNHDGHQAGFLEEGVFIGANMFVDMLDTEANNQFWQLGVGLEAGTRYLEVRGNYYIPLSDKQVADEFRTRETFQSTSSQAHQTVTPTSGGNLYATGNAIVQDAAFATSVTTTTRTTTIERLFRRYEEGMEGWDAELALLVPGLDKYFDLRFIGGYYSFDNQPFGPQEGGTGNVEGWKAGVEIRPVPAVILTGTWYEDERLTGSDWTAGVQLQVPFEMGDLGDGKGFWDRIGDAFTPRRRHLVERLAEPVHRQNAAVKIANSVEEEETETTTSVKRVTKVVSNRQGQIVIADDIVFVNNGDAVGNGIQAGTSAQLGANGTAERPYDTVTEGATTAGTNANTSGRTWSVYTQATGTTYNDIAEAIGSTKFISSFTAIVAPNGKTFGGNTARPVVDGGLYAIDIPFMQVTGYDIQGGTEGGGIYAENVRELLVNDNIVNVESNGVTVRNTGGITTLATISQNDITSGVIGVRGESDGDNTTLLDITVSGNIFQDATDAGVQLSSLDDSVLDATVTGNQFFGTIARPVDAISNGTSDMRLTIAQNELDGTFNFGISTDANDGSALTGTIEGNTLEGTYQRGIMNNQAGTSTVAVDTLNNQLSGNFTFGGIWYFSQPAVGGELTGTMRGNELSGTFGGPAGIRVQAGSTSVDASLDVTVADNILSGTFASGIYLAKAGQALGAYTVNVTGNTLSGTFTANGIYLPMQGAPTPLPATVNITDNLLTGSFLRGIWYDVRGNENVSGVVSNNTLATGSSYTTGGIVFSTGTAGSITITGFNGNSILGTGPVGMIINEGSSGTISVNGALDAALGNQVDNESGNKLESSGSVSGSFFLNGVQVTLPATEP
ncbi:inverse autotransporter-like protein with beta domain [Roseimicrobium gellanilyticum]|uniref:Inverse autotransporter-like protein with beta domain n=1 Tax=Roseimicrobium gellanilyticum TaxID=748857 RepID=A0A366HVF5_9BACT|nr:inverse autotransporter beta domain-containing protein [Roseimicrobium gellanilyticum]RBP48246.1 inverse autotransporter-like protein with beta domain [Roseimicrobium gellanilyticum]